MVTLKVLIVVSTVLASARQRSTTRGSASFSITRAFSTTSLHEPSASAGAHDDAVTASDAPADHDCATAGALASSTMASVDRVVHACSAADMSSIESVCELRGLEVDADASQIARCVPRCDDLTTGRVNDSAARCEGALTGKSSIQLNPAQSS